VFIIPSTVSGTVSALFTGYLVYPLVIGQYEVITESESRICAPRAIRFIPSSLNHKNTLSNITTI